jgi:hypothetical protein
MNYLNAANLKADLDVVLEFAETLHDWLDCGTPQEVAKAKEIRAFFRPRRPQPNK